MRKYTHYKNLAKYNEKNGFDLELALLTRVVKLESLHHGYWKNNEKLTLDNLKKAQHRYSEKIVEWIPKKVKSILDVGGGIGDVAKLLAENGYKVTTISPIVDQQKYYKKLNKNNSNKFILSKYEDLDISEKYDLVLMSESSNYIDLKQGMLQTKRYLKPNGYFLVFGIFSKNKPEQNRYTKMEFVAEASKQGLKLTRSEEITNNTVKTFELAQKYYDSYVPPLSNVLSEFYKKSFPLKFKLLSMFFNKEINLAKSALAQVVPERINPKQFKRLFTYEILLFEKK